MNWIVKNVIQLVFDMFHEWKKTTMFNIEVLSKEKRIHREYFCASSVSCLFETTQRDFLLFHLLSSSLTEKNQVLKKSLDKLDMNPVLPVNPFMSCRLLTSANGVSLSLRATNYTAYISTQLKWGTKPSTVKTEGLGGDRISLGLKRQNKKKFVLSLT